MEIYNRILPLLTEGLKKEYPFNPTEYKSERVWTNALAARAFDIARALLPIGTTTLLSWTTSLRAARDNLRRLKYHPLPEVRDVAHSIFAGLKSKISAQLQGDELDASDSPRDLYAAQFAERNHFVSADDIKNNSRRPSMTGTISKPATSSPTARMSILTGCAASKPKH